MMGLTVQSLQAAIASIDTALQTAGPQLTELDGKLGDGDLGITLQKAFAALSALSPTLPAELGPALQASAASVAKVSSSSFGTLLASSLLAAAKLLGSRQDAPWSETADLIQAAIDKMRERGRAALGDKTVLDAVNAAIVALRGQSEPSEMVAAARKAVAQSVEQMRDQPCKIGRARMFSERSIGMDDPGMMAFKVMVDALPEVSE